MDISGKWTLDWLFRKNDNFDDWLPGTSGHDVIKGLGGNDELEGGKGWDALYGGKGRDTFSFRAGDSGTENHASYGAADEIRDFQTGTDNIFFKIVGAHAGTRDNYFEDSFRGFNGEQSSYNVAMNMAEQKFVGGKVEYAFYTDGHDGFLFADTNHDGHVDTGIILDGLNSKSDFSWLDIHG